MLGTKNELSNISVKYLEENPICREVSKIREQANRNWQSFLGSDSIITLTGKLKTLFILEGLEPIRLLA